MRCESCRTRRATESVEFADGETFKVCEGCKTHPSIAGKKRARALRLVK